MSYMNLNLVSRRQSCCTSFRYCMLRETTEFKPWTQGESQYTDSPHIFTHYIRFRQVLMFRWGIIRHCGNNVSRMKKLAGYNFKDILQIRSFNVLQSCTMILNLYTCLVNYASLWRPSPPKAQQDCSQSLIQTSNLACVCLATHSHRQHTGHLSNVYKVPHSHSPNIYMRDMPILCNSRTFKGNSGLWITHSSTYCKAGHVLHEGEDECCSQKKEA